MVESIKRKEPGTLKTYLLGFFLSLLLTLTAYFVVNEHLLSGLPLIFSIVGLGVLQALVQLVLFLHLGSESKPRWNLLVFLFMTFTVFIVVFGSLWIMHNLNYRVMDMDDYMRQHEGI